jgi:hypothetical protein
MTSPIHVFYDGTHIDLFQIIEIGPVRVTENVQYPAAPFDQALSNQSDLRMWFEVVFKGIAEPRRYAYTLNEILGPAAYQNEVTRQYERDGLDSRHHNLALSRADAALAQQALDVMVQHRRSLTQAWIAFREATPAHEDQTIVQMLQALLDRQPKGIEV